ncbi:unnamed protein product, partial [Ixodes persulcatus]
MTPELPPITQPLSGGRRRAATAPSVKSVCRRTLRSQHGLRPPTQTRHPPCGHTDRALFSSQRQRCSARSYPSCGILVQRKASVLTCEKPSARCPVVFLCTGPADKAGAPCWSVPTGQMDSVTPVVGGVALVSALCGIHEVGPAPTWISRDAPMTVRGERGRLVGKVGRTGAGLPSALGSARSRSALWQEASRDAPPGRLVKVVKACCWRASSLGFRGSRRDSLARPSNRTLGSVPWPVSAPDYRRAARLPAAETWPLWPFG